MSVLSWSDSDIPIPYSYALMGLTNSVLSFLISSKFMVQTSSPSSVVKHLMPLLRYTVLDVLIEVLADEVPMMDVALIMVIAEDPTLEILVNAKEAMFFWVQFLNEMFIL